MARKKPWAIHPGEMLREEFMKPLGLTAYRLAKDLHVSLPRINDLVRERRAMTADTAIRLERYFGMPARFWMNVQAEYDIRMAAHKSDVSKIKPRKESSDRPYEATA
jgi:antitoxin HigA-1